MGTIHALTGLHAQFMGMVAMMTPDERARLCRDGQALKDALSGEKNACMTGTPVAQFSYPDDSLPSEQTGRIAV